jgi:hypothetical protein
MKTFFKKVCKNSLPDSPRFSAQIAHFCALLLTPAHPPAFTRSFRLPAYVRVDSPGGSAESGTAEQNLSSTMFPVVWWVTKVRMLLNPAFAAIPDT